VHYPEKLLDVDEKALHYYYYMIRDDFLRGILPIATLKENSSKWFLPVTATPLTAEQIEQASSRPHFFQA
jgi:hypothetical protein